MYLLGEPVQLEKTIIEYEMTKSIVLFYNGIFYFI